MLPVENPKILKIFECLKKPYLIGPSWTWPEQHSWRLGQAMIPNPVMYILLLFGLVFPVLCHLGAVFHYDSGPYRALSLLTSRTARCQLHLEWLGSDFLLVQQTLCILTLSVTSALAPFLVLEDLEISSLAYSYSWWHLKSTCYCHFLHNFSATFKNSLSGDPPNFGKSLEVVPQENSTPFISWWGTISIMSY